VCQVRDRIESTRHPVSASTKARPFLTRSSYRMQDRLTAHIWDQKVARSNRAGDAGLNKKFGRSFAKLGVAELKKCSILRELFRLWVLPGQVAVGDQDKALRIAVRDGYLNFYVCGQSVARIALSETKGVTLEIHQKYHAQIMKGDKSPQPGTKSIMLFGDALNPPDAAKIVTDWIDCAYSYRGAEKVFVEALIGQNSNILDIEMGLPGDEELSLDGRKTAPRMDVVTVVDQDGKFSLNFWEAKCAENPELRATAEIVLGDHRLKKGLKIGAPVAHQLQSYMTWLDLPERVGQPARKIEVAKAYEDAAAILLGLAKDFDKNTTSDACQIWEQFSKKELYVVQRPGIVICNYGKYFYRGKLTLRKNRAKSFQGDHSRRLNDLGFTVLEINTREQNHDLPPLEDGPLASKGPK